MKGTPSIGKGNPLKRQTQEGFPDKSGDGMEVPKFTPPAKK